MSRKRLFSALDREIKKLQTEGQGALTKTPDRELIKELLYLVALSHSEHPRATAVMKRYQLQPMPFNVAELEQKLEYLKGHSAKTIELISDDLTVVRCR